MKKKLIVLLSVLFVLKMHAQSTFMDNISIKETNFFYKDSIDNEVTYGSYEPTDIISLNDGSLVISTKFSINFPNQYKTPKAFTQEYWDKQEIYNEKSHISSGSLFILNENREKQWEIFFKEKRVEAIKVLSDETILVIGEDVQMRFIWTAKISRNGQVLDEKEYKFKRKTAIENVEIDSLDNVYILLSAKKLKIIDISKYYGKRKIRFFKETEWANNIYLLKISPSNKTLWKTAIDKRNDYSIFGRNLVIQNSDILVTTKFKGIKKKGNKELKDNEGEMLFLIGESGIIKQAYPLKNKKIFINKDSLLFTTFANKDSLILYKGNFDSLFPIETIFLDDEIKTFWVKNFQESINYNYIFATHHNNLGCLLIQLDKENKYIGYWKDSLENISSLVDGVINNNNSIVILSKHYSNPCENSTDNNIYSIKLIEIKFPN